MIFKFKSKDFLVPIIEVVRVFGVGWSIRVAMMTTMTTSTPAIQRLCIVDRGCCWGSSKLTTYKVSQSHIIYKQNNFRDLDRQHAYKKDVLITYLYCNALLHPSWIFSVVYYFRYLHLAMNLLMTGRLEQLEKNFHHEPFLLFSASVIKK